MTTGLRHRRRERGVDHLLPFTFAPVDKDPTPFKGGRPLRELKWRSREQPCVVRPTQVMEKASVVPPAPATFLFFAPPSAVFWHGAHVQVSASGGAHSTSMCLPRGTCCTCATCTRVALAMKVDSKAPQAFLSNALVCQGLASSEHTTCWMSSSQRLRPSNLWPRPRRCCAPPYTYRRSEPPPAVAPRPHRDRRCAISVVAISGSHRKSIRIRLHPASIRCWATPVASPKNGERIAAPSAAP